MKYHEFEHILSIPRVHRYLEACNNNRQAARTLYRLNMRLSHELFSVISMFEISLRNAIDYEMQSWFGAAWLVDAIQVGGRLRINSSTATTWGIVNHAYYKLPPRLRTPAKLLPELDFGVWHFMFSTPQHAAFGHKGLNIFVNGPVGISLTNTHVFNKLTKINELRNRLAHHESVSLKYITQGSNRITIKDTHYARNIYSEIMEMFSWMGIDSAALLYGLDHVITTCDKIDAL
ncbi:MAG: Abi family protein [Paludibacteraceae bacterium]|nr:Abi family protein [Paludibacteraceae bacterium]